MTYKKKEEVDELKAWLLNNRKNYEFYLLHKMMHDKEARRKYLPVLCVMHDGVSWVDDFSVKTSNIITAAMKAATKVEESVPSFELSYPPEPAILESFMNVVQKRKETMFEDSYKDTVKDMVALLSDPSHGAHWHIVDACFKDWFLDVRTRHYGAMVSLQGGVTLAGDIELEDMLDRDRSMVSNIHFEKEKSYHSSLWEEEEGSTEIEYIESIPTGLKDLDACLNGGFHAGESTLLFSPSGGGKTAVAVQFGLNAALSGKATLIIATEFVAMENIRRMVTNFCRIPYSEVLAIKTLPQLQRYVMATYPDKLKRFKNLMRLVADRNGESILHIHDRDHISADVAGTKIIEEGRRAMFDSTGRWPDFVILDWFGDVTHSSLGGSTSDTSAIWERNITMLVKQCSDSVNQSKCENPYALLITAQAVGASKAKRVIDTSDLSTCKTLDKPMANAIGLSCQLDNAALRASLDAMEDGNDDTPEEHYKPYQTIRVCKGRYCNPKTIRVKRDYGYQRLMGVAEQAE